MTNIQILEKTNDTILSTFEKEELNFHLSEIGKLVEERNRATGKIVTHVSEILNKKLWKEDYNSPEHFIKTILNLEKSSFERFAKANRMYLYLVQQTDDKDEQTTLSMMSESTYRELRRIATGGFKVLRKGGETDEDYQMRLYEKEYEDNVLIHNLWKNIYPNLRFSKPPLPNGGINITANDILISCNIIQNTMHALQLVSNGEEGNQVSIATLNGSDIAVNDLLEASGDHSIEVIESLNKLQINEALIEKLNRQKQHIKDKLEQSFVFDKYEGILRIKDGKLFIENNNSLYDLSLEFADLIKDEVFTSISIKRPNRLL